MKDTRIPLPTHAVYGTALGFTKRGTPIWPVFGGSEDGGKPGGTNEGEGGKPVIKSGEGTGEEGKKGGEGEGNNPPPVDITTTKEYKAEKKRADDLQAALDAKVAEHQTEDEKAVAAKVKAASDAAVSAKEIELTDAYESKIEKLQGQIVDSTIDAALSAVGRKRTEFSAVLDALDKSRFLDDDGAVKTDAVSKWASELAGSSSSKPPRTGTKGSGSSDRGFGRYLNKQA